ncbi:MAG: DUF3592 domain-containing protein [Eubacterium sp.]|nr:DUF3592 domain-containing protein [Eubacterium sp.]
MYDMTRDGNNLGDITRIKKRLVIFFLPLGLMFLIIGLIMLGIDKKKTALCIGETEGMVVEIISRISNNDVGTSKTYAPVINYTVDGIEYTHKSNVYSSPSKYTEGQIVGVHYNPDDPSVMLIDGENGMKLFYFIFIGLGGLFTVLGVMIFFFNSTKQ